MLYHDLYEVTDEPNEWGAWKISIELINKIKANDREAVNRFYTDNIDLIRKKATKFAARHSGTLKSLESSRWSVDDLVSQAYLDLPYFDYTSPYSLGKSLYYCFYRSEHGGYTVKKRVILGSLLLDEPKSLDNQTTFVNYIADPNSKTDFDKIDFVEPIDLEQTPDYNIGAKLIISWLKRFLSKNEYKVMFYTIFRNWTDKELSEMLNLKWNAVAVIRKRATRILSNNFSYFLEQFQCIKSPYYDKFQDVMPKSVERLKAFMQSFFIRKKATAI